MESSDEEEDAGGPSSSNGLSEYEQKRLEQIKRNRAMLESLGLLGGENLIMKRGPAASKPREMKPRVLEKTRELPQRTMRRAPEKFTFKALGGLPGPRAAQAAAAAVATGASSSYDVADVADSKDAEEPFIPSCPECDGEAVRQSKEDPRRYYCLDASCAHEWRPIVCGVCGQPKKGHTCPGKPKVVAPPPEPPKPVEKVRLDAACAMHDEVMDELGMRRRPATTVREFVKNARRAARLKRKHTELVRSGALEHMRAEAKKALDAAGAAAAAETRQVAAEAVATALAASEAGVEWMHAPIFLDYGDNSAFEAAAVLRAEAERRVEAAREAERRKAEAERTRRRSSTGGKGGKKEQSAGKKEQPPSADSRTTRVSGAGVEGEQAGSNDEGDTFEYAVGGGHMVRSTDPIEPLASASGEDAYLGVAVDPQILPSAKGDGEAGGEDKAEEEEEDDDDDEEEEEGDDEEGEYTVECILESKGEGKGRLYLVKWEGYEEEADNTWEPAAHLHPKLVNEFEAAARPKPKKPKPYLALFDDVHLGAFDTAWEAGCAVTAFLRERASRSAFAVEGEMLAHSTSAGAAVDAAADAHEPVATDGTRYSEWVPLDVEEGEEEAEARAEAELRAEVLALEREKRLKAAAHWRPKPDSVRGRLLDAILRGYRERQKVVKAAVGGSSVNPRDFTTTLTKEKKVKVPLWTVEGGEAQFKGEQGGGVVVLTKEGRMACGLPNEEDEAEEAAMAAAASAQGGDGPRQSPPPPPEDWVWPREGEKIEVEVEGEEGQPVWSPATITAVLVDGWFQADIAVPGSGDESWADWFTWQEENVDWRRTKKLPPKKWVWPLEGQHIEVEVRVAEEAPPVWLTAVVTVVLVDGWFAAKICLPDSADEWEDWFSWEEENTDWRRLPEELPPPPPPEEEEEGPVEDDGRPLPLVDDFIKVHGAKDTYHVQQTASAITPEFQLISTRTGKMRFEGLLERDSGELAAAGEEGGAPPPKRKKTTSNLAWRPVAKPKRWTAGAPAGKGRRSGSYVADLELPATDGPSPEGAKELYAALSASVDALKALKEDGARQVHGWEVRVKVRPGKGGKQSADVRVVDPADGVAFTSMLALKRKLGLAAEPAASGEGSTSLSSKHIQAATAPVDEGPRKPPPPPPDEWAWPHEGQKIEVDVEGIGWVTATVTAVLEDSWFSAEIILPDDSWTDWFTWQEEGSDWRRKKSHKKKPAPTGDGKPAAEESKVVGGGGKAASKRKRSEGGDEGKAASKRPKAGGGGDGTAPPPAAEPPPLSSPKSKAMPTSSQIRAAKAKAALAATSARARAKNEPMTAGGVCVETVVEVVQWEVGLVGSRYQGVVLEVRRDASKRKVGEAGATPDEALVEYDALYDDPVEGEGGLADGVPAPTGANGEPLLREWVPVSALRPPPTPPDADWHESLAADSEVSVLHDGGWWDARVVKKTSGRGAGAKFEIAAVGYDVKRIVDVSVMRPHPSD